MNLLFALRAVLLPLALFTSLHAAVAAPAPAAAGAKVAEKLSALGLTLPATSNPVANYVPAVRSGSLVFLAGHLPRDAAGKVITGKVARGAMEKEANAAARQATLAALASLQAEIGDLNKVKRIVRVGGFVNAAPDFEGQSQVINGCSDLLVALFGDRGRHARAAIGVGSLPLGAIVEIEMVVEVE